MFRGTALKNQDATPTALCPLTCSLTAPRQLQSRLKQYLPRERLRVAFFVLASRWTYPFCSLLPTFGATILGRKFEEESGIAGGNVKSSIRLSALSALVLVLISVSSGCSSKSEVERTVERLLSDSPAACEAFDQLGPDTAALFVEAATSNLEDSERAEFRLAARDWLINNC